MYISTIARSSEDQLYADFDFDSLPLIMEFKDFKANKFLFQSCLLEYEELIGPGVIILDDLIDHCARIFNQFKEEIEHPHTSRRKRKALIKERDKLQRKLLIHKNEKEKKK